MKEELKKYKKGDIIIKEGSIENLAYVIKSGKVKVVKSSNNNDVVISVLKEKDIFGEMGLIDDKPRSASVIALEDTEVFVVNRKGFNAAFSRNSKAVLPIVKVVFERLRNVNRQFDGED